MSEKTNTAANLSRHTYSVSRDAQFLCGATFDPSRGGIVRLADNSLLSVSDPKRVPDAKPIKRPTKHEDQYLIAANRVGRINLSTTSATRSSYGLEWEFVVLDRRGKLHPVQAIDAAGEPTFMDGLQEIPNVTHEFHRFALELGVPVSHSWMQAKRNLLPALHQIVVALAANNLVLAPLDIVGSPLSNADRGSHPYMTYIADFMFRNSGFPMEEVYAMYGIQSHCGLKHTSTSIQAGYYMQFINPLLAAATLGGPFYRGYRELLSPPVFTDEQYHHLERVGLTPEDFVGRFMSRRYLLRRAASPSAGTWRERPPITCEGYLDAAHTALSNGKIFSIDRLMGEQTDRLRLSIPPNGTFENCSFGNVGNVLKAEGLQLVSCVLFETIEHILQHNQKPERLFPLLFADLTLEQAHRDNLLIHRYGMDAKVIRAGNEYTVEILGLELRRMLHFLPKQHIPKVTEEWFFASYTSSSKTRDSLKRWCARTGQNPSLEAFHQTGTGIPAIYLNEVYDDLMKRCPNLTEAEVIRQCELDLGQAFMQDVNRLAITRAGSSQF